jgi:hypothetical protein
MSQQHGYEFSILPIPQEADGTYKTIAGYGWTEDQSCQYKSAYIDTWHQILSGQTQSTPSLNVDGYFTNYPSNATVLLRRTVNGQPAMLMYDYGAGKVIVTSMYSDFAYGHSQASSEEITLVRDLISWAKQPANLPQIKPGETVSLTVELKNDATADAASAKLLIYNPDKSVLLSEQTTNVSIPVGQTNTVLVSYPSLPTSSFGIYHIDYELYDTNGDIIQPQSETDSGRFVVTNPPANPYQNPDFNFSVQSDAEYYVSGSNARFTINMWNNTDRERTITCKYGGGHFYASGSETVTIPAKGVRSIEAIGQNITWQGWLHAYFYDENNTQIQ